MPDGSAIPDIDVILASIPKSARLIAAEEHETALSREIEALDQRLEEVRHVPVATESERRQLDKRIQSVFAERAGVQKKVAPARRETLRLREDFGREATARCNRVRIAELAALMQEITMLRERLLRLSMIETKLACAGGDAVERWMSDGMNFGLSALERGARLFLIPLER